MARDLTISYGSISMGGNSDTYLLDGKYTVTDKATERTVSWRVVVTADADDDFNTACAALEAQFRTRFESLTISFGAEVHIASGSEGFLEEPSAVKLTEAATTGLSRVYECSVTWRTPASDNDDLVWGRAEVAEDTSHIRTFTFTGQMTATSANGSARSNAESNVPDLASSLRPSGDWDEGILVVTIDEQDKLADFSYEQREIIYDQSEDGLNHESLIRPAIVYQRTQPNPGDSPHPETAKRRSMIVATYSTGVAKGETTDLHDLYRDTIRPYLISQVQDIWSHGRTPAIASEVPTFDKANNRIQAQIVFECDIDGGGVFSYAVSQDHDTPMGRTWVGAWCEDPDAHYEYQGHRAITRATVIRIEGTDEEKMQLAAVAGFPDLVQDVKEADEPEIEEDVDENWRIVEVKRSITPIILGDPQGDEQMKVYRGEWIVVERYVTEPPESGGKGAPGTAPSEESHLGDVTDETPRG